MSNINWQILGSGTIDWTGLTGFQGYYSFVYKLLGQVEGINTIPYWDTASPKNPTIGLGYNFSNSNEAIRNAVFADFDLNVGSSDSVDYPQLMRDAIGNLVPDGSFDSLNSLMLTANANGGANRTEFKYEVVELEESFSGIMVSGTYEQKVNSHYSSLPMSKERAVLISLAFGNENLINGALKTAINTHSDRAEAWFEIRFNSNGGEDPNTGIAKRRYIESEVFGLYDKGSSSPNNETEALYALRMFTKHEQKISNFETLWPTAISSASADLAAMQLPGVSSSVSDIDTTLSSARSMLINTHADFGPELDGISAPQIAHVWVAADSVGSFTGEVDAYTVDRTSQGPVNDLIFGALGVAPQASTLKGGSGDDVFIGGNGAETMYGGTGIDTVSYRSSTAGVSISLDGSAGTGGTATGDRLYEVENIVGSIYSDIIVGDSADNTFNGGPGADKLVGGAGNDRLVGGNDAAADILEGGTGFDTYYVNNGDIISDPDNQGAIFFGGKRVSFSDGLQIAENSAEYHSKDGVIYTLTDSALTVRLPAPYAGITSPSNSVSSALASINNRIRYQ